MSVVRSAMAVVKRLFAWKILAPVFVITVIALSLQACNTPMNSPESIRASEPTHVIPFTSDPTELANCIGERYGERFEPADMFTPIITSTRKHVRFSAYFRAGYRNIYMWEVLLKNGEAQVHVGVGYIPTTIPIIIDMSDTIAGYVEVCVQELTPNDK